MKSNIYFKFMSYKDFETLQFDGLTISVTDLKEEIIQKKNLGKKENYDLILSNSQTGEEYKPDALIHKNTSVNVARIPVTRQAKRESRKDIASFPQLDEVVPSVESITKASNIADLDVSEEEKVKIMIEQSNSEFAHINYTRTAKAPLGIVPRNYVCHKCGQPGHFIQACPKLREQVMTDNFPRLKRSTGIPNSFMRKVSDINTPGVLVTSTGELVVPAIDAEAYKVGKKERPPFLEDPEAGKQEEEEKMVPRELLCPICQNVLNDAVVAPCCGDSACDDCIRSAIMKSPTLTCPMCLVANVSCDALIANKFIRTAVINYQNEVGYTTVKSSVAGPGGRPALGPPAQPLQAPPQMLTQQALSNLQPINHQQQHQQQQQQLQHQQNLKDDFHNSLTHQDTNHKATFPIVKAPSASVINESSIRLNSHLEPQPQVSMQPSWLPSRATMGEVMPVQGMQGVKMVRVLVPRSSLPPSSTPYTLLHHPLNFPPPPLVQPMQLNNQQPVMVYPQNANQIMAPPSIIQGPPLQHPPRNLPSQVSGAPLQRGLGEVVQGASSNNLFPAAPSKVPLSEEEFYRAKQKYLMESSKQKDGYISTDSSPSRAPPSHSLPTRQKDIFEFAADIMYGKAPTKTRSPHSWSSDASHGHSRSLSRSASRSSSSSSSSSYSSKRSSVRHRSASRSISRRRFPSSKAYRHYSRSPHHRHHHRQQSPSWRATRRHSRSRDRSRNWSGRSRERSRGSRHISRSQRSRSRRHRSRVSRRRPSHSRSYRRSSSSRSRYHRSPRRYSPARRSLSRSSPWRQRPPNMPSSIPPHQDYPSFPFLPPYRPPIPQFGHSLGPQPRMPMLPQPYNSPPPHVRRRNNAMPLPHQPPFHLQPQLPPHHQPHQLLPLQGHQMPQFGSDLVHKSTDDKNGRFGEVKQFSDNVYYPRRSSSPPPKRSRSGERMKGRERTRDERMDDKREFGRESRDGMRRTRDSRGRREASRSYERRKREESSERRRHGDDKRRPNEGRSSIERRSGGRREEKNDYIRRDPDSKNEKGIENKRDERKNEGKRSERRVEEMRNDDRKHDENKDEAKRHDDRKNEVRRNDEKKNETKRNEERKNEDERDEVVKERGSGQKGSRRDNESVDRSTKADRKTDNNPIKSKIIKPDMDDRTKEGEKDDKRKDDADKKRDFDDRRNEDGKKKDDNRKKDDDRKKKDGKNREKVSKATKNRNEGEEGKSSDLPEERKRKRGEEEEAGGTKVARNKYEKKRKLSEREGGEEEEKERNEKDIGEKSKKVLAQKTEGVQKLVSDYEDGNQGDADKDAKVNSNKKSSKSHEEKSSKHKKKHKKDKKKHSKKH